MHLFHPKRSRTNKRRVRRLGLRLEPLESRLALAAIIEGGFEFLDGSLEGKIVANGIASEIPKTAITAGSELSLEAGGDDNGIRVHFGSSQYGQGMSINFDTEWPAFDSGGAVYVLPTTVSGRGSLRLKATPELRASQYENYREEDGPRPVIIQLEDYEQSTVWEHVCDLPISPICQNPDTFENGASTQTTYQVTAMVNGETVYPRNAKTSLEGSSTTTLVVANMGDEVQLDFNLNAALSRLRRSSSTQRFIKIQESSHTGFGASAHALNLTASNIVFTDDGSARFSYFVDDGAQWLANQGIAPEIHAYWATGPTLDDRIPAPEGLAKAFTGGNFPGFQTVQLEAAALATAPAGASHILFYVDPEQKIAETAEYLNFTAARFVPRLLAFLPFNKGINVVDGEPVFDPAKIDPNHLLLAYSVDSRATPVAVEFYAQYFDATLPETKLGFGFELSPDGLQNNSRVTLVQDQTGEPPLDEMLERGTKFLKIDPTNTPLQSALEDKTVESVVAKFVFRGGSVGESPFYGVYQAPQQVLVDTSGDTYTVNFPIVSRARAGNNETISAKLQNGKIHAEFDLGFGAQGQGEILLDIPPRILMIGADGNERLYFDETITMPVIARTGGGNDIVVGGVGEDDLDGGEGDDILIGEGWALDWKVMNNFLSSFSDGKLALSGSAGFVPWQASANDVIRGGAGIDLIVGGGGNDTIDSGADNGFVFGDSFSFIVSASSEFDLNSLSFLATPGFSLSGNGEDNITSGDASDLIIGGDGDDTIRSGDGNLDWLVGNGGNDTIVGGSGFNVIIGGDGNDTLTGGHDGNLILGDSLVIDTFEKIGFEDMKQGRFKIGVGILPEGKGNDTITGGRGTDFILGGDGDDTIDGGGGDGWNVVFCDAFSITAGIGFDFSLEDFSGLSWATTFLNPVTWYQLLTSVEASLEGSGNDQYSGADSVDIVWGGAGDDILRGGAGFDFLIGGDGNDEIDEEGDHENPGENIIFGGEGNDLLRGGNGNDWLESEAGNDTFYGNAGDDRIFGGLGDDVMFGGAGNDQLFGEEGNAKLHLDSGDDQFFGGTGRDTLAVSTNLLDLTSSSAMQLTEIDVIDLNASAATEVLMEPKHTPFGDSNRPITFLVGPEDRVSASEPWRIIGWHVEENVYHVLLVSADAGIIVANSASWQNPILAVDTNGSGSVTPLDALLVINELNAPRFGDASGNLPDIRSFNLPPLSWLDVNGDGKVFPIDALLVINHLNREAAMRTVSEGEPVHFFEPDVTESVSATDDVFAEVSVWRELPTPTENWKKLLANKAELRAIMEQVFSRL